MEEKHKKVLNRNMAAFTDNLNLDDVIPYLISTEILSQNDVQKLESFNTLTKKVMNLIFTLQRKGPQAFKCFLEALEIHHSYNHLVLKINDCLKEYDKVRDDVRDTWQWSPMSKHQSAAVDHSREALKLELPFDDACEYFLDVGLLEQGDIAFMKKLPAKSRQISILLEFVEGKGKVAYELLIDFLQEKCPRLETKILEAEKAVKEKLEQFQELVTFTLKYQRIQEYTGIPEHLNVILIGKTGNGKSATGNTIIGKDAFLEVLGTNAGTKTVQKETTTVHNVSEINVLDTPGLFDTSSKLTNEDVILEIMKTAQEFSQGIHLFLFVCRADVRFTDEEADTFEEIQRHFGENLLKHCLLVVTHASEFAGKISFQKLLESNSMLNDVVKKTSKRALAIENREENSLKESDEERQALIHAMVDTVSCNGGLAYSSSVFDTAKEELEKEKRRAQLREKIDELTFRMIVFKFPTQSLSEIEGVRGEYLDFFIDKILADLDSDEISLMLEPRSLVQTYLEDQKDFIRQLVDFIEMNCNVVASFEGSMNTSLEGLLGRLYNRQRHQKNLPESIIPYVLKWFQNIPDKLLNEIKEGKSIPEHDIKIIVMSVSPKESLSTQNKLSHCILTLTNIMCWAFERQTQRRELLNCIRTKCTRVIKAYYTGKTYKERTNEIETFLQKGFIPPSLHCLCLRAIPSKFKSESWYDTIEKLLLHTLRDRMNTESSIFTKVLKVLKIAGSVVLGLYIPMYFILAPQIIVSLLRQKLNWNFVPANLYVPRRFIQCIDCNECGGCHRDKRFTPL